MEALKACCTAWMRAKRYVCSRLPRSCRRQQLAARHVERHLLSRMRVCRRRSDASPRSNMVSLVPGPTRTRTTSTLCVCVFRTQRRTNPGPDHRQGRDPLRGGGVDPVHTAASRKQGRLAGSPPSSAQTSSTILYRLGRCSTNGLHHDRRVTITAFRKCLRTTRSKCCGPSIRPPPRLPVFERPLRRPLHLRFRSRPRIPLFLPVPSSL